MSQKYLGEFEEVVLLTIGIIYEDAYGAHIRDEIQNQLGRVVRLGALHATLVRLENGASAGYEVFAEGWLKDGEVSGRPVDVLQMPDGSLLVSDDRANAIYRITYQGS